jgi:hypothetical protein
MRERNAQLNEVLPEFLKLEEEFAPAGLEEKDADGKPNEQDWDPF